MSYKQKHAKIQEILNEAEQGGGGVTPENVYTKTECDNKFETITDAASTYQTKAGMNAYWTKEGLAPVLDSKVPTITDATGTYFVVNGIRVYVATTAPTGDIPDGSIGIGW